MAKAMWAAQNVFENTYTIELNDPAIEERKQEILREAIACGADDAVLVSDRAFAGSDTLATSYALSCAIKKIKDFDLH